MKKIMILLCLISLLPVFGCQATECLMPEPAPAPEPEEVPVPEETEALASEQSPAPEPISPDAKLVCLFFDDCFQNQYDVALPILREHDFKATFGVITGYIGTGHDLWEYMDEDELKVLVDCGMDIACHTRSHPDLTANLTDEKLREEIVYPKTHLENMGFRVYTVVYPYYRCDNRVIQFVMEAGYTCGRVGWSESRDYDPRRGDPKAGLKVPSWQITNQSMDDFKTIVDRAGRYSVVSLVYHFITDEGPVETSTPVNNFKEQMDYLKEAGFTVVLLPDIVQE